VKKKDIGRLLNTVAEVISKLSGLSSWRGRHGRENALSDERLRMQGIHFAFMAIPNTKTSVIEVAHIITQRADKFYKYMKEGKA
jgi:hypothetical protein